MSLQRPSLRPPGLLAHKVYQRIARKTEEELAAVKDLYAKVKGKSIQELLDPLNFCQTFLN
ncbi:MAG: hypothetical protein ACK4TI_02625, partial [Nitrososphaerales archaeon]